MPEVPGFVQSEAFPAGDAWNHFDLPTALDLLVESFFSSAVGVTVGTATALVPVPDWPAAPACMPRECGTKPAARGGVGMRLARTAIAFSAGNEKR